MSDRIPNEHRSFSDSQNSQPVTDDGDEPGLRKPQTGVHPAAIEIALGAALWFIVVTWVSFARGAGSRLGPCHRHAILRLLLRAVPVHGDLCGERSALASSRHELPRIPAERSRHGDRHRCADATSDRDRDHAGLARARRDGNRPRLDRPPLAEARRAAMNARLGEKLVAVKRKVRCDPVLLEPLQQSRRCRGP